MRYFVIGPARAQLSDGTDVAVGGPRVRALLAALALRAGRPVPVGVLVDEVWGADPPADAVAALQALVGRLRRALGRERERVLSVEGGYRLDARGDDVDLLRFERLVGEGTRQGEGALAVRLLDEALGLWQGDAVPLADLSGVEGERARWGARRVDALRVRFALALEEGESASVLPELTALCAAYPLDETLQALRLRALRDAGRSAEALAAYEGVRRELVERLGVDPSAALRGLHGELLSEEERVEEEGASWVRGNLVARLTSFLGRDRELGEIAGELGAFRLVTLFGTGGVGKTRLSQEVGDRVGRSWSDGVWFVELAPVTDPAAVVETVLGAVGARETVLRGAGAEELRLGEDTVRPVGRLVEHCARRRMLLVLDNCEHVVGAVAELVEVLLARCPGVTVLATSREPLGVPGEVVRPVGPLPVEAAVRLFGERGAAVRPGFRVEEERGAAEEIVRRLDGLPLAVELAAARLRVLSAGQIAERLDDRFRLLSSGARTVLPRQQTLRAVVDWSWELLDEGERGVLRRLSVFAGGCELEAAEAVCGGGAPEVLDVLGALVDKSLVVAVPGERGMRYRLLETVAEYASERLDEGGERGVAERRHLEYYRELARVTDPALRGGRQTEALARFGVEYGNLRTALGRAVAAGDEHEALVLVHSLLWYWTMRDLRADALHWSEAVAALGPDPFGPGAAPVVPLHEAVTAVPPPLSEEQLWEARRGVRLIELLNMDHETGRWTTPEGLARLRVINDRYPPGLPQTCRLPGSFSVFAVLLIAEPGRMAEALDAHVAACRRHGYDWELGNALQLRANMLANRADLAGQAAADAEESLRIFVGLDDAWGAAEALSSRAEARERRLEFEGAAEDFEAAIGYARRVGAQSQMALLRARYADMLMETGRQEEAEKILQEVVEGGYGRGHEPMLAARIFLAMLLGRTGRTAEAREQLLALLDAFSSESFSVFEGFTLGSLAWVENLDGRYASALGLARRAYDRSLGALSIMVAPQMPAIHLVTAAWALAGIGGAEARMAGMLLGAYEGLLPPGHLPPPMERENLARATGLARDALGAAAFEAAHAEGGGLSLEEAAALLGRADAINGRAES
ncbi:BTAD domain-containing putative transcriptional regulator [Streptomyces sp. NPDC048659]|uniref:ATP-binding protein n=1 Tax=Streptomyces sp. NPDC048659 TaxID=3155489 RepID=UPI003424EAFF